MVAPFDLPHSLQPYTSLQAFTEHYFLPDLTAPFILQSLDLVPSLCRLYRSLLSDRNDMFSTRMINAVLDEYGKKEGNVKETISANRAKIEELQNELQKIMKNKKQSTEEIDEINKEIAQKEMWLKKSKAEYFRPLYKAIYMLDSVLGQMEINKSDVNLAGLGKLLTEVMGVKCF